MEPLWNDTDRLRPKYSDKNVSYYEFVHHKSHTEDNVIQFCPLHEKIANSHLSYDTREKLCLCTAACHPETNVSQICQLQHNLSRSFALIVTVTNAATKKIVFSRSRAILIMNVTIWNHQLLHVFIMNGTVGSHHLLC